MSSSEQALELGCGRLPARTRVEAVLPDEELMSALRDSLEDAPFEELLRRHAEPAWRIAASLLGAGAGAEDAVQETFLRVIRRRSTYRRGASFRNWLYAILRNVCRDELRRPARCRTAGRAADGPVVECDPAVPLMLREEARAAWGALARLPGHEREVLALRLHGGMDFPEIARCCGISPEAARQRASRGLDRLRRELAGNPVTARADDRIPVGRDWRRER